MWSVWLEVTLLAPVPHRKVVLAVPKRLRPYFYCDRALLGVLSRVAARTSTAFVRATTGERTLAVGFVAWMQTNGSLVNWHAHRHLLVTDGGFRPDGIVVPLRQHDVATLSEAFCRAVLRWLVRRGLLEEETALGTHAWPHSGFHMHDKVLEMAEQRWRWLKRCALVAAGPSRRAHCGWSAGRTSGDQGAEGRLIRARSGTGTQTVPVPPIHNS